MFDIHCKKNTSVSQLCITSLAVRGALGNVTVYAASTENTSMSKIYNDASQWKVVYKGNISQSWEEYHTIVLSDGGVEIPIGKKLGFYIHSSENTDASIVYDNLRGYESSDPFIQVLPGQAHLCATPFQSTSNSFMGCWRRNREFVGKIGYGTRVILWQTKTHHLFNFGWRKSAAAFYMIHATSFKKGLPADVGKCALFGNWRDMKERKCI